MTQDSMPNDHKIDQSENESVEQRLTALEEHNQELEAQLEQQETGGPSNVTRRGALGVLGGGALLGAAGSASAQDGGRGGGAPFADEDHDHSGDYLGEGEPVDRIDVNDVNAQTLDGIVFARREDGEDINDAINKALAEAGAGGVVVAEPGEYTKNSDDPVTTSVTPTNPDQTLLAYGVEVEPADNSEVIPVNNGARQFPHAGPFEDGADGFKLYGGTWRANWSRETGNLLGAQYPRGIASYGYDGVEIHDATVTNARRGIILEQGSNGAIINCVAGICSNGHNFKLMENSHAEGLRTYHIHDTSFFFDRCESCTMIGTGKHHPEASSFGFDCRGSKNCTGIGTFEGSGGLKKPLYDHAYFKPFSANEICEGNTFKITARNFRNQGADMVGCQGENVELNLDGSDEDGNIVANQVFRMRSIDMVPDPTNHISVNARNIKNITQSPHPGHSRIRGVLRNVNGDGNFFGPVDVDLRLIECDGHIRLQGDSAEATVQNIQTARKTTNAEGKVSFNWGNAVTFANHEPNLSIQLKRSGSWFISEFTTDSNGEYNGATLQITDLQGSPVGSGVPVVAELPGNSVPSDDGSDEETNIKTYPVTKRTITIDGNVSELDGVPSLTVSDDFSVFRPKVTVSGNVWVTWDSNNLYLAADLVDDTHIRKDEGSSTWERDLLQLGVASGEPGVSDSHSIVSAALTTNGPQIYRNDATQPGNTSSELIDAAKLEIVRNEETDHTVYEVALPWDELAADPSDDVLALSFAIIDDDGNSEGATLENVRGVLQD